VGGAVRQGGSRSLALQDEVTGHILHALVGETGQLKQAQFREAWGKDTASLGEYDHFLRGLDVYMNAESAEENDRAGDMWREALRRYPDSALLKVKLGWYHWTAAWRYWSGDLTAHFGEAGRLVSEVLATDNLAPEVRRAAYWLNANVLMQRGEFDQAVLAAESAAAIAPHDARMLRHLTDVLAAAGRYETALEWLARAEPREPGVPWNYAVQRGYLYRLGRYEESLREYETLGDPSAYVRLSMAIDFVRLGRMDEAREQVRLALEDQPDFTQALWREGSFYSDPAILEGEIADVAAAGLPPD
jgi:tetratricopeptide (TPR) repeat protein